MTREILDIKTHMLTISPEPLKEGDYWPPTCWKNTDNTFYNPSLIAAKILAEKGFGITFEIAYDVNHTIIPGRVAIHVATPNDRETLEELDSAPEVRYLQRTVYLGKHTDDPISWYENAKKVIQEVIEQKKLDPLKTNDK